MSNPVVDKLQDWQPDASAADQNLPQPGTNIGIGTTGDLNGELRRIKSELRAVSVNMSWERWLGLRNLADDGFMAFTFVDANTFTVNDNLTFDAVIGRRVKALLAGGVIIFGTIASTSFVSPTTTVVVNWDNTGLDGTLAEVQFGPELRAVQDDLIAGSTSDSFPIFNTAALSSLYTLTIPKNALATGIIHGEVVAFVNSILNGSSIAFYFIYYGGTTLTPFPDIHLVNGTGSSQGAFAVRFTFRLAARQALSTLQTFSITAGITAELPALVWRSVPNLWTIHRYQLPAVDSTFDQPFSISAQWSLADVGNSVTGLGIDLWRTKR